MLLVSDFSSFSLEWEELYIRGSFEVILSSSTSTFLNPDP